jgi:RNA polymerase sigma-70 factor, ECF subfamily
VRERQDEPGSDPFQARAIARAKEGDMDALHYLYVLHANDVYGFVRSIVRDDFEAEDVTQNVFAKLMRAIQKYEPREVPFAAWILRVARNAAVDSLRARRALPCDEVRTSDEGHEQLSQDRVRSLKTALDELPEQQREVVVLRHIAGLSPGEIAERLDKSEGAIHGLHHRGRGALQTALRELEAAPVTAAA